MSKRKLSRLVLGKPAMDEMLTAALGEKDEFAWFVHGGDARQQAAIFQQGLLCHYGKDLECTAKPVTFAETTPAAALATLEAQLATYKRHASDGVYLLRLPTQYFAGVNVDGVTSHVWQFQKYDAFFHATDQTDFGRPVQSLDTRLIVGMYDQQQRVFVANPHFESEISPAFAQELADKQQQAESVLVDGRAQ